MKKIILGILFFLFIGVNQTFALDSFVFNPSLDNNPNHITTDRDISVEYISDTNIIICDYDGYIYNIPLTFTPDKVIYHIESNTQHSTIIYNSTTGDNTICGTVSTWTTAGDYRNNINMEYNPYSSPAFYTYNTKYGFDVNLFPYLRTGDFIVDSHLDLSTLPIFYSNISGYVLESLNGSINSTPLSIESKPGCYLQKEIVEGEYNNQSFYNSGSTVNTNEFTVSGENNFSYYVLDGSGSIDYNIEFYGYDSMSYSGSTNSFNINTDLLSSNPIRVVISSPKPFEYIDVNLGSYLFGGLFKGEYVINGNSTSIVSKYQSGPRYFPKEQLGQVFENIKDINSINRIVLELDNHDYENITFDIGTVNQVYNEIEVCYEYDEVNGTFNEYINSGGIDLDKEIDFYNDDINKLFLEIKKYITNLLNLFTFSVDPDYKHYLTIFKPDNTKVKIEQIELNMKPDLYGNPDIDISLKREVVDGIEKIYLGENVIFERELTDFRIFLNYFLPTVGALLYYIFYIGFIALVLSPVWLYRKFLVGTVNLLFPADIITKTHNTGGNIYSLIPFIIYTVSFYGIAIYLMANILRGIAPVAYNIRNFIAHLFDLLLSLGGFDGITIFTIINTVNISLWATIIGYIVYLLTLKYGKIT